jgi:hypothetical protein
VITEGFGAPRSSFNRPVGNRRRVTVGMHAVWGELSIRTEAA